MKPACASGSARLLLVKSSTPPFPAKTMGRAAPKLMPPVVVSLSVPPLIVSRFIFGSMEFPTTLAGAASRESPAAPNNSSRAPVRTVVVPR